MCTLCIQITIGLSVLLVFCTPQLTAQRVDSQPFTSLSSLYFQLITQNQFQRAAALFHYPKQYSQMERQKDLNAVSVGLALFSREFGKILSWLPENATETIYHVSVGGSDLKYWQRHPKSYVVGYSVEFEKEGKGYIGVRFCNIVNDKWEIRDVIYALPKSQPTARARITKIMSKMMQMMQDTSNP